MINSEGEPIDVANTYLYFFNLTLATILPNWKQLINKENPEELTVADLSTLLNAVKLKQQEMQAEETQEKIKALKEKIDLLDEGLNFKEQDHLTIGIPPDDEIELPITMVTTDNSALNTEAMLKKMRELVDNNSTFSLYDKNCSETVGQILAAGCMDPGLRQLANTRAIGAFGNPQEVVNKAVLIQAHLIKHSTPGFLERLSNFSPITYLNGALLKVLVGNAGDLTKASANLALLVTGSLAFASFMLRGIFNPAKAFSDCMAVFNFAFPRKLNFSTLLFQVAVVLTVGTVATIFAIPAAIQHGINKFIINPIRSIFSYLFGAKTIKETSTLDEHAKNTDHALQVNVQTKELEVKQQKTPAATLQAFMQALFDQEKAIPYFTTQAIQQISKAIKIANNSPATATPIIDAVADYAQQLKKQDPEKFARLQLSEPTVIKNMNIQTLYKTLSELSLVRANTATLTADVTATANIGVKANAEETDTSTKEKVKNKVLTEHKGSMLVAANNKKLSEDKTKTSPPVDHKPRPE